VLEDEQGGHHLGQARRREPRLGMPGPERPAVALHEVGRRNARVAVVRRERMRRGGERDQEG
jgi:hypothetical protein